MKKILLSFILLSCITARTQTLSISDNSSREKLVNVIITDKNNKSVSSDNSGKADISELEKSGDIYLYHPSYSIYLLNEKEKTENSVDIRLTFKTVTLDEIVLSANRQQEHKIDVPYKIDVIQQKEIEFVNQQTSADLLQNTGAVFVQKSQMGGGSPVLRGFEANKVLIVVDGIRMNNAIYRGGHLQDIISLDANMLERTEVVFGPASTIYGSDALGGVMHFYTKKAEFSSTDKMLVKTNAFVRYSSANKEQTGHIDLNLGWKKIASITNVTYSNFGDLLSGNTKLNGSPKNWDRNFYAKRFDNRDSTVRNPNSNLQVGSAYSQLDFMQRFNIKSGEHIVHGLNFQLSQSSDIPRYDRLTEMVGANMRFAEWNYGPQKRLLASYSFNFDKSTALSDNFKIIAAYQKIDQDRISRRFQNKNRVTQMEDVTVLSLNLDAYKRVKEKHELRYGLEVQSNAVTSTAESLDITTDVVNPAATRYGDGGNSMNTAGIYLSHSWEVSENFVITDGIRATANSLESKFKDTTFIKFPFTSAKQNNQALTGSLGFTWKEENDYKISLLANTGFRTPNIDDMSKVFESTSNILIVPNTKLKPEYAYNFEMTISKIFDKKYKFDFTAFYTILENALVTADYTFNNQDTILIDGTNRKVQAVQNKDRAYIYGISAGVQFDFNKNVSFKSIINYTYGRYMDVRKDTVVALDHIPPVFGQTSIIFKEKNADAEFFVRYNGKKSTADYSASGEDNAQYSANTKSGYMPGWFTLNIRLGYNLTKKLRVNASCENITDNRYRVFASGINAPGRNFIVSLRYKF
ncbi:TonB-dependent receptor plug domain-containing protein [Aurantibacillus circumpalustris]|uniref:TonB-dependent receptor plug domain-containing protein n=1 Tax=Aurantibacillus circumpalustris TaxID=3036359 RepID=UPI00295B7E10|nr:TonB-dependent receptor [Aurantibacillus circumpalustris]